MANEQAAVKAIQNERVGRPQYPRHAASGQEVPAPSDWNVNGVRRPRPARRRVSRTEAFFQEQAVRCWSNDPTVEQFAAICGRFLDGRSERARELFLRKLWGTLKYMGGQV